MERRTFLKALAGLFAAATAVTAAPVEAAMPEPAGVLPGPLPATPEEPDAEGRWWRRRRRRMWGRRRFYRRRRRVWWRRAARRWRRRSWRRRYYRPVYYW